MSDRLFDLFFIYQSHVPIKTSSAYLNVIVFKHAPIWNVIEACIIIGIISSRISFREEILLYGCVVNLEFLNYYFRLELSNYYFRYCSVCGPYKRYP